MQAMVAKFLGERKINFEENVKNRTKKPIT
jgi:hypothetical protein